MAATVRKGPARTVPGGWPVEGMHVARANTLPALRWARARGASGLPGVLWQELRPAGRFALLGFAAAALVTISLGVYLPSAVRDELITVEGRWLQAATATLEGSLPPLAGRTDLSDAEYAQVERVMSQRILGDDRVRVKLWSLDGVVLYSDAPSLVGRRFPSALPRLREATDQGISSDVTDLGEDEHVAEGGYLRLVEFYVRVRDPDTGRPVAVLESYEDVSFLVSALSTIRVITWSSVSLALVALVALLALWVTAMFRSIERRRAVAVARIHELGVLVDAAAALASSLDSSKLFVALRERVTAALGLSQFAILAADVEPQGGFAVRLRDGRHVIAARPDRGFTVDDERLLRAAAQSLDIALANAALYEQVQEAAAERRQLLQSVSAAHEVERRRIVGELHDTLASQLLRAVYAIRRTASAPTLPARVRADLVAVEEIVADSERQLREVMNRVLPSAIDSLGLSAALEELVVLVARESDLDVSLDIRGEPDRLPDAAALLLLRGAEEALLNVRKHAIATRVRVILAERRMAVIVVVEDDGIGWGSHGETRGGRGLGLAYLRERVAGFAGSVRIGRGRLGGASLIVRIPRA